MELEPNDASIKTELNSVKDVRKKKRAKEQGVFGKMFDQGKLYLDKRAIDVFEKKTFPAHDDNNPVVFFEIIPGTGPSRRINIEL